MLRRLLSLYPLAMIAVRRRAISAITQCPRALKVTADKYCTGCFSISTFLIPVFLGIPSTIVFLPYLLAQGYVWAFAADPEFYGNRKV